MKLGRSILAYLPVNLATMFIAFGGLAILTRVLEAEEYGRYAIAMVTMLFVHMSAFTWLEAAIARFQARAEREANEATYLKTIYATAGAVGVVGITLICTVLLLLPIDIALRNVLIAAVVSTGMQLSLNLGFEAHKASHRIGRYSGIYSTHQVLSFTLGLLFVMLTPVREVGMFLGIGVSVLIIGMIDLPFMLKKLRGGRVETARLKTYFNYGMPISISLVLAYALNSADVYLIKAIMGEASVGMYSAGYNLANRGIDVMFIWIGMAMTPIVVTAFEKDGEAASVDMMRSYASVLLWITLPAATGLALVAEPLGFILGENVRAGAIPVMPLIAFAGVLNGLISYYVQRAFMLSGHTARFAWLLLPPVLINLALNLLLIPRFGLQGAVWATVASYAIGLVISFVVARRIYPLPLPARAFCQVVLACAVMAGAVLILPDSLSELPDFVELIIKAAVGATVYGIVCFATDTAGCRGLARDMLDKFRGRTAAMEPAE